MKTLTTIPCLLKNIKYPSNFSVIKSLVLFLFITWISASFSECSAQSPWTQKADMTAKRGWHSSCVLNGKIYSMGGLVINNPPTKTVQIYDPNTDIWTYGTDMLEARASYPSCVINEKIWVFGGASDLWFSSIKSIEEYDPETDEWNYIGEMPRPRQGHTASLMDGKIYIMGGCNTSSAAIEEIDVYDTLTKTWSTATPMPTPRAYHSSVILNDAIYTIGGIIGSANNEAALATVQAYHPATDTWEEKSELITPRKYLTADVLDGKIYVIGGKKGGHAIYTFATHVEKYDPAKDTWSELSKVPKEYLRAHSSDTINNMLYIFGGACSVSPVVIPTMYTYDPLGKVSIPDTAFLKALFEEGVDTNGDSLISYDEAEAVISLDVNGSIALPGGKDYNIIDLTGIEAFVNLDTLRCDDNPITSLNISNNKSLRYLSCGTCDPVLTSPHGMLINLDVSHNPALTYLRCDDNEIASLNVSANTSLKELWCNWNLITTLDISNNSELETLWCMDNLLTSLDVSKNLNLLSLACALNQLTDLNVTNNSKLQELGCGGNLLTNLDVSNNPELERLNCWENQLTSLDISNNTSLIWLNIHGNPNLSEVCVWSGFNEDSLWIDKTGCPNVYFTKECTIGIEEQERFNISIYPNPTNTLLTIEIVTSDQYNIEITSLNGQLLFEQELEGNIHQIDLSSFQKGVYLITIRSNDFTETRKLIKLK